MKKIVIIPDSFKGTISSQEAGRIIEEEAKKRWPDVETVRMEIADGGEGSVDAFLSVLVWTLVCFAHWSFSLIRKMEMGETIIHPLCGVLPVKRTMKNNKFFSVSLLTGWRYFYAAFNVSS